MDINKKLECPLGGDETNCHECAYGPDYEFNKNTGECELRK
jgi:hypothetical protein